MWPDLLRGIMGNLSTYGMQPAPQTPPSSDPQLSSDLAAADANLRRFAPVPPMNPNPSIDEMIAIAQQMGRQPKTQQQIMPDAPPQTVADASRVARPQTKGKAPQQTMLNVLMQHLLSANGAPPSMSDVASSPQNWQDIYKYYHPTLTPGQPLPLRMR